MLFLVSCVHQIRPSVLCDISFEFKRCRCRLYDLENLKSLETPKDYPLNKCEGIAGFYSKDIAIEILPKIKAKKRHYHW